ncbi:class I SAM-dependent methyltransferase [Bacillota bacterium Lsc_1132]
MVRITVLGDQNRVQLVMQDILLKWGGIFVGHRFNPEKAGKLLDPKRREIISPNTVIKLLDIQSTDTIADLGAGNGYFTVPMAHTTEKEVFAVDIEPKMLALLKEHAANEHASNIVYLEGNLEEIPLENQSADKALIAFVTHEVPNVVKMIGELKRVMKPSGKILILEWDVVNSESGPPIHERIPSEQLKKEFEENGLHGEVHQMNEQVYALLLSLG